MAVLYRNKDWDTVPSVEYWKELFRVSKNQIVFGANYFIEHLKNTRGFICWDKKQAMPTLSACELIWTSFDCPAKIARYSTTDLDRFHPTQKPIEIYDWLFNKFCICKYCKGERGYYEDIAGDGRGRMYVNCDCIEDPFKILDTHVGSGSSRIAADKAGLDFTGYELDKDYWEAQERRYNEFKQQIRIEF